MLAVTFVFRRDRQTVSTDAVAVPALRCAERLITNMISDDEHISVEWFVDVVDTVSVACEKLCTSRSHVFRRDRQTDRQSAPMQ